MDELRLYSQKAEDLIDRIGTPIKPYIPVIARFLLVATFLEDSLRISTQWSDQVYYLERHQNFWSGFSQLFLILNVVTMLTCSTLAIAKKHTEKAVAGLFLVVISQSIGYGLIFDSNFFLRNLSVMGALLMLLSDALSKRKSLFAGLPTISETSRSTYFQLAGRILLVFLFLSFIFAGDMTFGRLIVSVIGFVACIMVVIGFKAKWSAMFLVLFLSISNVFINNWWAVHHSIPQRDFMKYDFFQCLSIAGGLLLLYQQGPGGISVDERKKAF